MMMQKNRRMKKKVVVVVVASWGSREDFSAPPARDATRRSRARARACDRARARTPSLLSGARGGPHGAMILESATARRRIRRAGFWLQVRYILLLLL